MRNRSLLLGVLVLLPLAAGPDPLVAAGRAQAESPWSSGGSTIVSPSVMASYRIIGERGRDERLELLILWRGSPGWFLRPSPGGSMMSGGDTSFTLRQGGLRLTATVDRASRVVRILDEDVQLGTANVVLVDDVDAADGPRFIKTVTVAQPTGQTNSLHAALTGMRELLDYVRCLSHVPDPQNRTLMNTVCAEAIARGWVTGEPTVTPIPTGPIRNRAADLTPVLSGPPARPGQLSSSSAVSPVVMASYFARREASGENVLDLMVLWRGSLGWHMQGSTGGGGSGGSVSGQRRLNVRRGPISLNLVCDALVRTCDVNGTPVALGADNVVLVDDVDAATGSKVVKTVRIDPSLPEPVRIEAAIAKSPELVSYVRCDLKLPNERQQAVMDVLCARIVR